MSFQILVVDDTKFMRKMLTDILKQYGHEVVGEAENGRQAVQKYEELQPDIVLMDITMPEMDGIEAMKAIRVINPSAVVLICSAMSQQDLISDALKAGANGYVMKPFKPNRVNEIVRKYGVPRVIGHLIPQEMQPAETAYLEPEIEINTPEREELTLQASVIEDAHIKAEAQVLQTEAYDTDVDYLSQLVTETVEETVVETTVSQEIADQPVNEELNESEAVTQSPTEEADEISTPTVEEKKATVRQPQSQVVNALEVVLAFAEVAEIKEKQELETSAEEIESTEEVVSLEPAELPKSLDEIAASMMQNQDNFETEEELERLIEMERLAAMMQGDLEKEWKQEVKEESLQQVEEMTEVITVEAIEEPPTEMELVAEPSSSSFSLDELNDLTMEMAALESAEVEEMKAPDFEIPAIQEQVSVNAASKSQDMVDMNRGGFKAVNGGKIINLFRGNGPMKNFTSSYMCNWNEELNGDMTQYLVKATEAENKIEIEMAGANGQKQSITVTIDSFNQLAAWLQVQLGTAPAPVNSREFAKKADF